MKAILENVIKPLVRRVGSVAAGSLVTWGATAQQAAQVEAAIGALALIAVDLWLSNLDKKK